MLRIVSFVVAVAAILAIPFTQADARHGGRGGGAGMRMGSAHFSGARSFSRVHIAPRRVFVANHRIRHHRGFIYSVGLYDTCWRWVPTAYGLRRVWVCDPYSYY